MSKERRKEIRIPLLSESIKWAKSDKLLQVKTCNISDISKNGMFIESTEMPNANEILELYIQLPEDLGIMIVKGKVKWRRWAVTKKNKLKLGFGVEIIHDNPKYEKIIESYVIYLRNKQIIKVSKRIIEEFFAQNPPNDKGPVA